MTSRALWMKGPVIGLSNDIPFRADREYTFCRICGELFQPALERLGDEEYDAQAKWESQRLQRAWADLHNKSHPDWEHKQFTASGAFLSPEATHKLVPFGVIPLSDLVFNPEAEAAGLEAPRESDYINFEWHPTKRSWKE